MYQVFCRSGRKYARWRPYSGAYRTREEADACLREARARQACDIYGLLIRYEARYVGGAPGKPYEE